jgi:hypothetical protein
MKREQTQRKVLIYQDKHNTNNFLIDLGNWFQPRDLHLCQDKSRKNLGTHFSSGQKRMGCSARKVMHFRFSIFFLRQYYLMQYIWLFLFCFIKVISYNPSRWVLHFDIPPCNPAYLIEFEFVHSFSTCYCYSLMVIMFSFCFLNDWMTKWQPCMS